MNIYRAFAKSARSIETGISSHKRWNIVSQQKRSMADYIPPKGAYDGVYRGKLPLYGHLGPNGAMYDLDPKVGLYEGLRGLGVFFIFFGFTYFYWDYLQNRAQRLKAEPRELPYADQDFYRASFAKYQDMATIKAPETGAATSARSDSHH
eukprot:TRINITY_DN7501_c0_g1_i1.p1 TRINITY_DN7501_c0_g1~~TRINITY_DN7501_c0_g1_i1.p1  ORF type:complete len:161 (+),score=10.71 TRINITY_DN7501_c0_g1_i1:35-484(+)